jgi:hypothetical protein
LKPAVIELTDSNSGQGKESMVVWLDTDGRFTTLPLYQVLHQHLAKPHTNAPLLGRNIIAKGALQHVHVFRSHSSAKLISTFDDLSNHLLKARAHAPSARPLSLLILDSATTFHSQDRFGSKIARHETPPSTIDDVT